MTFNEWVREVINTQASPDGNAVSLDDFSSDGNSEYFYPKEFTVEGDKYRWYISKTHTPHRHLCTHYEIWFHGRAFGISARIATGMLTKEKIRKGLKQIFNFYYKEN